MSGEIAPGWSQCNIDAVKTMMAADAELARSGPPERWREGYGCDTQELVGGLRCDARSGRHSVVIDEPLSVGGSDTAANPIDVALAALGASLQVTARLYALDWNLRIATLRTEIRGTMDIRGFFDAEPTTPAGLVEIQARLLIGTDMRDVDLSRLAARVARCCPVLSLLGGEDKVSLSVVRETEQGWSPR